MRDALLSKCIGIVVGESKLLCRTLTLPMDMGRESRIDQPSLNVLAEPS